ncbi:unnamed protein product [Leptidea sinapis]|uniref:Protein krueppel n=1 Tax=Leptidea sinapis TaxID=189913 RepID=A0A5E4QJD7_9NEOP|nr:unnamed protein product [Leptidea sinapis]
MMDTTTTRCRCCLAKFSHKDLYTPYTYFGKVEVFGDMLKECFNISIPLGHTNENGICDTCVSRLREAIEFKTMVQQSLKDLEDAPIKKYECEIDVKEEADSDNGDSGMLLYALNDEQALNGNDDNDDMKLADILGLNSKKLGKKKSKKHVKAKDDCSAPTLKISLRRIKSTDCDMLFVTDNKKHRNNVKKILKHSNCTPFSNKTIAGIVCAYCKMTFKDIHEVRTHVAEEHSTAVLNDGRDKTNLSVKMDITDLKCNICSANMKRIAELKKHLTAEHDIKFYPDLYDYILEFKLTDGEILNCALCSSTFETFKMLLQHMNGHYRNYICEVCDMGFINKHRLSNHKRTHETGTFKCSFCDKIFTTKIRKMCHEKYTHNTNARYTTNCPHCDQSFNSYYQRNRHMFKEHNTAAATYKCNVCDKSFILKSKLTSHIKKVHLMERNHICPDCGQGFFIKQSLDEHMIKHNGERVFKCLVCHKAYARKKTLREHMRIHNNDRRFKCGLCGQAFVQKCSMKSHMLSNHGVTLSDVVNDSNGVVKTIIS